MPLLSSCPMGAVARRGLSGASVVEQGPEDALSLSLAPRELDLTLQITLAVMVTLPYLDLKGRGGLEYANIR